MSGGPRFSVIIPNYNNGATLARAIDSILAQAYPAHEIIVIDDGSNDNSRAVAESYGEAVIYHHQTNAGVSVARNHGVSMATGDWLTFLDADDIYLPERLQAHADLLSREPGLDFLFGEQEERTPEGKPVRLTFHRSPAFGRFARLHPADADAVLHQADFEYMVGCGGLTELRTLSVPRASFVKMGGFANGMRIGEDVHFLFRLCARSATAGFVPRALTAYYLYEGSAVRKDVVRTQEEFVRMMLGLESEMRQAPKPTATGYRRALRASRMSLAYAYLRAGRKLAAIGSTLPMLYSQPGPHALRDVLSVARGLRTPR
jgi:glycosyltransferase involved in cell wall biosynthesis